MSTGEWIGNWLARQLDRSPRGIAGGMLANLDEHFNLRYLSDRLRFERSAIDSYLRETKARSNLNGGSSPGEISISVVSPVYGIPIKYVRRYIRSLRKQTHTRWELCLCVDGDPDPRIRRYMDNLAREEPDRFRLNVHASNEGICAATRDALALASGDVIAFVDTDDTLHPEALNVIAHAYASDPETDITYTNHDILTPWGYRIDPVYKPGWSPELIMACNYVTHLATVRKSCLDGIDGLWSEAVNGCQDWDFLLRAAPVARRIHHAPLVLYHWRAIGGSEATRGKPWAWGAARTLQESHLSRIDDRLEWDFSDAESPPRLVFREGRAPCLRVFVLGNGKAEQASLPILENLPYPGEIQLVRCQAPQGNLSEMADHLDRVVRRETNKGDADDLFWFVQGAFAEFTAFSGIECLAAFASLPQTGACWPFYGPWRGGYGPEGGLMQPRDRQTGFFTSWSSNTLTGPLNGLMTSREAWQSLGGFRWCIEQVPEPQPLDALGALYGLAQLGQRRRNVSVNTIHSEWVPPVLDLGPRNPSVDPYR